MSSMIVGAITLRPKNESGSYHFMSLHMGRKIHLILWTVLHVTDEVVQRVHELAERDGIQ